MNRFIYFILLFLMFSNITFAKELKKVSLQLSWFDQFQFAGYYIAKKKGIYEKYGLDVEIRPFNFGINVSDEVNNKKADFAVDRETLVLQKVAGKKLVALYALFQESPLVLLSKKDSGIDKIQDFHNKKIMTTIDDAGEVSLKSMIISKGLKIENLNFIKHTHNIMDLVDGKTDVISAYLSKTPYDLNKMGIEHNIFSPKDYGFDMYSDFLFTHEDKVKNDLETVLAFKEASLEGWEYAYSHIDETADYMFRNFNSQNISLDALIFEGNILKELSYSNIKKLGQIKPEKIQRIYDLYNIMGLTPIKIDLNDFILYKDYSDLSNFTKNEIKYIVDKKKVNTCILVNVKPYSFIKDGKYSGVVAEFFDLIIEKTKLNFEIIEAENYEELLSLMREGKCDISPAMHATKDRKNFLSFTDVYGELSIALTSRTDTEFIDDISILKDKIIALPRTFSYNHLLKERYPNNIFVDVKNLEEGLKKVANNEVYAYIDLLHPLLNKIREEYIDKLKISSKLDMTIPISIAIFKNDRTLLSILNKSIKEIPKDEIDRISAKWVNIEYKKEFDTELLWKILTVFILILISFLYRQFVLKNINKDLQRKVDEKTIELQTINASLEKRINEEVETNLKKDRLLARQSKMAAMGEMIQNIAHQWRQPLSVISTGASGLKIQKELHGSIDDKLMDKTLGDIVDTSVSLSKTIDDFMHFFKPSKDKKVFKLSELIDRTLNIFDYNLQNEKIELIKNIEDKEFPGYESELIQVIANLLTNSKEAFLENNIENKILFINTRHKDGYVFIEIKDNAGGIEEKILDKIFEPYFTTKHQYQGTGIGLYMCQEIISKHMDGVIEAKNVEYTYSNKVYKGAMFTIKIKG